MNTAMIATHHVCTRADLTELALKTGVFEELSGLPTGIDAICEPDFPAYGKRIYGK